MKLAVIQIRWNRDSRLLNPLILPVQMACFRFQDIILDPTHCSYKCRYSTRSGCLSGCFEIEHPDQELHENFYHQPDKKVKNNAIIKLWTCQSTLDLADVRAGYDSLHDHFQYTRDNTHTVPQSCHLVKLFLSMNDISDFFLPVLQFLLTPSTFIIPSGVHSTIFHACFDMIWAIGTSQLYSLW